MHLFGRGEPAVAWVAARQLDLVTIRQLTVCGLGRRAVSHRLAHARLARVHRGIYRLGPGPSRRGAAELAAALACGPGALTSHASAGALYGILAESAEPPHVTVAGRNPGQPPGIQIHRTQPLHAADARRRGPHFLTAPARTLVDLAGQLTELALERAVDEAFVHRLIKASEVEAAIERAPRRAGLGKLLELLGANSGLIRSEAERRFLALVRAAELPLPDTNVRLGNLELDALWREQGVAVEIDGYRFHSQRGAFERDRVRDATVGDLGLRVLRFTWRRIDRRPEAVVASVARALALAGRGR